jgi:NAD-dependent DNA ligase
MVDATYRYLSSTLDDITQEDIKILQDLVQFHRKQYYEYEKPLITDDEFDRIYALLVA